ncbi:MAG TPA: hypothetical protein VFD46_04810 [Chryseolinea sp.]|jgi:hypothetical protein|nr:hypothetical protein [Chryseolinea sp.]
MKKLHLIFTVLFATLFSSVFAQEPSVMLSDKPGWHKIGEVKADFEMENQSISVLGEDKFQSILLKVTDAPINIEGIQVFNESGGMEEYDVKNELKPGSETRKIDLKGGAQEIKKITFTYKTLANQNDKKAHVELYGLK